MILYHGTDEKGNDGIIRNGYISITNNANKRYRDTTFGYIYVTTNIADAIDFSIRPQKGVTDYPVILFEIEIDEVELIKDTDEEKWKSTIVENGYMNCYMVDRNLELGKEVKRRFYKYFSDYKSAGRFMQAVQNGKIKIQDDDWENVP